MAGEVVDPRQAVLESKITGREVEAVPTGPFIGYSRQLVEAVSSHPYGLAVADEVNEDRLTSGYVDYFCFRHGYRSVGKDRVDERGQAALVIPERTKGALILVFAPTHTEIPELNLFEGDIASSWLLAENGELINIDHPDLRAPEDDRFKALMEASVDKIVEQIERKHKQEVERRHTNYKRILAGILSAPLAVGAGLSAKTGYEKLIVEPREADKAARQAYDELEEQLPGPGLIVSSGEVESLTSEEFGEIPNHKKGEDLDRARIVGPKYYDGFWCTNAAEKLIIDGVTVWVAVEEGSDLDESNYEVRRGGEICITNPEGTSTQEGQVVAIQIGQGENE